MVCVNFESDGVPWYARNAKGEDRTGNSKEAAEWVDYCNNPSNKERNKHGFKEPLQINHWQLGNEPPTARVKDLIISQQLKKQQNLQRQCVT